MENYLTRTSTKQFELELKTEKDPQIGTEEQVLAKDYELIVVSAANISKIKKEQDSTHTNKRVLFFELCFPEQKNLPKDKMNIIYGLELRYNNQNLKALKIDVDDTEKLKGAIVDIKEGSPVSEGCILLKRNWCVFHIQENLIKSEPLDDLDLDFDELDRMVAAVSGQV